MKSATLREALQYLALQRERDRRWVQHLTRRTRLCQACRVALITIRAALPRKQS